MSGAFNDIRIECKQSVAGLFQPADIVLKVNDVIQVPDGTGATVPGAFNGATAHYLALGGLNNNSATDCAWGDVTVSNDVTFDPDAPIIPPAPAENLPAGFVQDGAVIGFVADQDYTAGMIAIAGNFVGTIVASVKTGNVAGLRVIGTSLIDKVNAAEVIGAGTPVYVEPGSLKATATEAGNVFAGHAVLNSESGDAKVKTRLRQ